MGIITPPSVARILWASIKIFLRSAGSGAALLWSSNILP